MSKYVRLFFNRKKKATETVAGAIEIVWQELSKSLFASSVNAVISIQGIVLPSANGRMDWW